MTKVVLSIFIFCILACQYKQDKHIAVSENQNDDEGVFFKNEQIALDTLKTYELQDSVFKSDNTDYFIHINRKIKPQIAIVGDRHGKKFFFTKKEKWDLFLIDTTYDANPMSIYFKDLNGDYKNDIYLEDFQGSGCFPYCYVLLQSKENEHFEHKNMYSDLGSMNFDYPTQLLHSEYSSRTGMSKSRYKYVRDTLELIDVVDIELDVMHTDDDNDSCVVRHRRYKNDKEIFAKKMKSLTKNGLKYYNNCLWKTSDVR